MTPSEKCLKLIREFEGCRLEAYKCPAGKLTIGYGWTRPVDGVPIHAGMKITKETAERLLKVGADEYGREVSSALRVSVSQSQFDALVSFAYNFGLPVLSGSTLLRKLNAGDYAGAAAEFPRWNKSKGKPLPGLTRRREAERCLFLS
ncbi:lysozyme [Edwardsiella piscicida]|uniref:Endolysin n=1 Tax=Edwardsiella phage GF-2 TaxID=1537091 RepID=A0A077KCE6_9CAUD|nr:endolysin [Edwardsiella phage GF-2]ELM3737101.1 lysozyme [Edwardsiella piscicida]BAP28949.1 putative lysozyme [Edwardsiella phage GF-2]